MLSSLILGFALIYAQGTAVPAPNPLDLNPEMKEFLDQRIDRTLPELDRLQALDAVVFHDPALRFTYGNDSRTAIETFTGRSGNCLSFTLLFIAMARYVGLDARFREVEIAPLWSMSGAYTTLNQHLNAAVVIGGKAYVVDVFPGVNRIEIGGTIVNDQRGLAHFYNNKAIDELARENLEGTETYLRKALEVDPTAVSAWVNLGVLKIRANQNQEAEKCYRKAIELDSHDSAALGNLAIVLQRTGRTREAARYLAKVKAIWEKNPYHHFGLGMRAFEAGRYEESITYFRKALKLKGKEHNFYFAMARAYAQLREPEAAMNSLLLAAKYAPDPSNKDRYNQKLELLKSRFTSSPDLQASKVH